MKFDQDTNRWSRFWRLGRFFLHSLFAYDVFHFHTSSTLLPHNVDLPVLRAAGRKIFFHFHGSEIRVPKRMPKHCLEADGYFVSIPDLLEIVPEAVLLPQQIDFESFPAPPAISADKGRVVIVHAIADNSAYRRQIKGTDCILNVFDSISRVRNDVEFRFFSDLVHDRMICEIAEADIIVDQIAQGWYGNLSVEAMALGKTVLNWIDPKLTPFLPPGCPIVNTCKETLQEDLVRLIDGPSLRESLGEKGRHFVERFHAVERVAQIAIQCYLKSFENADGKQ
jgi:hypothetical protein